MFIEINHITIPLNKMTNLILIDDKLVMTKDDLNMVKNTKAKY